MTNEELKAIEELASAMTAGGNMQIIECADVGKALERLLADRKALVERNNSMAEVMNKALENITCGNYDTASDLLSEALGAYLALQEDR